MTKMFQISGDLLGHPVFNDLFLRSPVFVLLEHVFEVAALRVDAGSAPDQQVLRGPPHLGRGQAAQIRAHEVLHPLHADRLDSSDLLEGHTPQVIIIQRKIRGVGGPGDVGEPGDDARPKLILVQFSPFDPG